MLDIIIPPATLLRLMIAANIRRKMIQIHLFSMRPIATLDCLLGCLRIISLASGTMALFKFVTVLDFEAMLVSAPFSISSAPSSSCTFLSQHPRPT